MNLKTVLKTNLKELRKEFKYTQKEVAKIIGIKQQTYAGYESGRHEPNLRNLMTIATMYNVSIDFLLGLKDCEQEFHGKHKYCTTCIEKEDCKKAFKYR